MSDVRARQRRRRVWAGVASAALVLSYAAGGFAGLFAVFVIAAVVATVWLQVATTTGAGL